MTRAQRSDVNKQVARILNEVGEVGALSKVSDERLVKLITAGSMQLATASGPAVSALIMPRLTAYVDEATARGIELRSCEVFVGRKHA